MHLKSLHFHAAPTYMSTLELSLVLSLAFPHHHDWTSELLQLPVSVSVCRLTHNHSTDDRCSADTLEEYGKIRQAMSNKQINHTNHIKKQKVRNVPRSQTNNSIFNSYLKCFKSMSGCRQWCSQGGTGTGGMSFPK